MTCIEFREMAAENRHVNIAKNWYSGVNIGALPGRFLMAFRRPGRLS
jgi:hypothetical protein